MIEKKTNIVLNLLINRSILAVLGSVLQRATPIILGAIILKLADEKALFEHNTWFIAASLCAAITAGGLTPHILRKFSNFTGLKERNMLPSFAFLILFFGFIVGYTILKKEFPSPLLLLASFSFSRMMISIAILQARAKLIRVVLFQLLFLLLTISITVVLLTIEASYSWTFYAAYGFAALPVTFATLKVIPLVPKMFTNFDKEDRKEIINYSLYGIFGVAVSFMVLLYLQEHMLQNNYNQLVFTYQLYSFIIFIPGILSVVTVPFLTRSAIMNEQRKIFLLPFVYFIYALPITFLASFFLVELANLYGFNSFNNFPALHFILYAAIPTSIVAGLNQMNIVSQRSLIPLVAVFLGNITLVFLMMIYLKPEDYGYALFMGMCVNATVALFMTLLNRTKTSLT